MKICKNFLLMLFLVLSCSKNKDQDLNAIDYYDVPLLNSSDTSKKITGIKMDTITLTSNLNTSYIGNLWVNDNKLYFSDYFFAYVFQLSLDGSLVNTFLGMGGGPTEIPDLDDVVPNSKKGYTVLSSSTTSLYRYDNKWRIIDKKVIDFNIKRNYKDVYEIPIPSIADSYELETGRGNIMKLWDKNHIAIAINATHPKFNGYFDSNLFYNYSRVIALINTDSGKIDRLVGRRSPYYLKNLNIPNFNHFNFEVSSDRLYLSFMPDKYIYVIDKDSERAIGKFGESGRDMKVNYIKTDTYEAAKESFISDTENYGYYHYLTKIHQEEMIIRHYSKGKGSDSDGLQIYKNFNLIADIVVPLGFRIIGKIDDNYIGFIKDPQEEEKEELVFYKVTFNYENN